MTNNRPPQSSSSFNSSSPKRLFIVGAGGFGREVWTWINHVPPAQRDWALAGFLDANPQALKGFHSPVEIVDDPARYQPRQDDVFICALGDPRTKLRVCRDLQSRGAKFITFVHPTALLGPRCTLGEGCVLCPYSIVSCDVSLGDFVMLNVHSNIGHDARLGDGVTLSGHCDITGGVTLEEGVFLGSHAAVTPGIHVPQYTKIGAGSVVCHRPRAGSTVLGVPARRLYSAAQAKAA